MLVRLFFLCTITFLFVLRGYLVWGTYLAHLSKWQMRVGAARLTLQPGHTCSFHDVVEAEGLTRHCQESLVLANTNPHLEALREAVNIEVVGVIGRDAYSGVWTLLSYLMLPGVLIVLLAVAAPTIKRVLYLLLPPLQTFLPGGVVNNVAPWELTRTTATTSADKHSKRL